ncbi:Alcohol dehydrogenase superfamily, zinc-type domain-containing protein [Rozella allomycis CSF55]|uniref:enoyl-[acyl-carrier-protein] reductase n=1 Tax=Rozella allomycis (strain CSF55) TaxID=988480 RepID=A0A075AUT0_ROZAC|nr:Alcohol dehydrogenase superfamily, zinc-type domain-containing protein [Rozella allomycis CSF55]|eukprot:EPZ34013.1 Alcohol dehydrogenase superfamily, zinc-type domain-containing protein [Rozella allomycis CSF55]
MSKFTEAICYKSFGSVLNSLYLEPNCSVYHHSYKNGKDWVRIGFRATPINPSDINQIEGVYPVKPNTFPAVGGNEGVAQVLEIGQQVKDIKVGDFVIPRLSGFGTWRRETICDPACLFRVHKSIGLINAATVSVNLCSAYRMLHDYISLSQGSFYFTVRQDDVVIQNAANSGVGKAIIQICKHKKIKNINVIRKRETTEESNALMNHLKQLGSSMTVFEDDLINNVNKVQEQIMEHFKVLPILGLNAVGGENSTNIFRLLNKNGAMVTYGAMSKKPIKLPTGPFIFDNKKCFGFWMSQWYSDSQNNSKRSEMMNDICSMIEKRALSTLDYKLYSYKDYQRANPRLY